MRHQVVHRRILSSPLHDAACFSDPNAACLPLPGVIVVICAGAPLPASFRCDNRNNNAMRQVFKNGFKGGHYLTPIVKKQITMHTVSKRRTFQRIISVTWGTKTFLLK